MSKKILVIDDDPLVLKTLKVFLSRSHYEVTTVKNGQEARTQIHNGEFNLIMCDIRMPDENGIQVMTALKQINEELERPTPFFFITGYAHEEAPIEAIKLGTCDYILKPFDLEELSESVKKHIS